MTIDERKTALVFGGARGIGTATGRKTFKRRLRCRLHICFATGQRCGRCEQIEGGRRAILHPGQ